MVAPGATVAFSQRPLSCASRPFAGLILKGNKGSILRVRIFLPERSVCVWRVCRFPPFDRNLAHWSQLGPAGAFSTSFASWGSTQRGKGIVRISVDAIMGQRETR